jgi:hypothetical protein
MVSVRHATRPSGAVSSGSCSGPAGSASMLMRHENSPACKREQQQQQHDCSTSCSVFHAWKAQQQCEAQSQCTNVSRYPAERNWLKLGTCRQSTTCNLMRHSIAVTEDSLKAKSDEASTPTMAYYTLPNNAQPSAPPG